MGRALRAIAGKIHCGSAPQRVLERAGYKLLASCVGDGGDFFQLRFYSHF
ncbi:MAG TPA: hypothetical protein IGP91_06295 [Thermosynechococcus sp. M46_R2017_013]|nr:hypothetical protein [Thermosynechococcus sp. M46_R2017_013]